METPYGITNDAGQLFGKAVVFDAGNVTAYVYGATPTDLPPGQHNYASFDEAKTAVGGNWQLFGAH